MIGWYLMARSKARADAGAASWEHWRPFGRSCRCKPCRIYFWLLASSPLNRVSP